MSSTHGEGRNVADALEVRDLQVHFYTRRGVYKALNGVNLALRRGEVLGIAGESGCGKSTLGLSIMSLLPRNAAVPGGRIIFDRKDLVNLQREYAQRVGSRFRAKANEKVLKRVSKAMAGIRGMRISMVFQEPMTSLNPVLKVGFQIAETIYVHNPALLARRALARTMATPDLAKELLSVLRSSGGDEGAVKRFAAEHGITGIEEQALFVWRRKDVHISRKEKAIRSLAGRPVGPAVRNILEVTAKAGRISSRLAKVPVLSKFVRRVLIAEGYRKAEELMTSLGIPHAERVVKMFPHELSGGMRQRVVIAIALANNPEIVIMDEPTSAVDVTVQAQILEMVKQIRTSTSASFIFISHDLAVLAEVCDRIAIMYAGRVVEVSPTKEILSQPLHPYTQSLISAIPNLDAKPVEGIKGEVPDMREPPAGCAFHPRCPFAFEKCLKVVPIDLVRDHDQVVDCWLYEGK